MKKLVLITTLLSASVFQASHAADGVINFTGNITDAACVVDTSALAQPVDLGNVSVTAFNGGTGTTAAAKRFNIVLKSCPASVTGASVRFDGVTSTQNPDILALSASQTATNVGVALYEQDNATPIAIGMTSNNVALEEDVDNTLTYFAKYMSTGTVGPGTANSSTAFTVVYQ